MIATKQPAIAALVLLNVVLQVLDGLATYAGLQAGFGEGNPVLRHAMSAVGTGPALLLFKLEACACLAVMWALRTSRLVGPALVLTAVVYLTCAIGPWTVALAAAQRIWGVAPYTLS